MDKELLIAEIKKRGIPPLHAQKNAPEPIVYLEISIFDYHWRWYVTGAEIEEGGRDILFFGFVLDDFAYWDYFRFSELEEAARHLLVFDSEFEPQPFSEIKKAYNL
jgi:hypothetical protein